MPAYQWTFDAKGQSQARSLLTIIQKLDNILGVLTRQTQQTTRAQTRYTRQAKQSEQTIRQLQQTTQRAATTQRSWFGQLVRSAGVWNTLNKAWSFGAKRLKQLGGALTYVFRQVIRVGGAFEQAEITLKAFLGEGAEEAIQKAKLLGRTTQFTAEQAAKGAITLARAGRTATQVVAELEPVLAAAAANQISLAQAAKIGAVGMNQFARTGESVKDILEIFTAASKESPTNILELGRAMKNVAPIAAQLGMNATQTAAVISLLAKVTGETAGRAGTRMMIFLRRLASLTPAAAAEIKRLGIVLTDSQGKFLPTSRIVDQFRAALSKIPSEAKKMEVMKTIFGRSFSSVIALVNAGGAALRKMQDDITKSRKVMETLQEMRMEAMTGSILKAKSAWEGFWIKLKDFLGTPITQTFTLIASAINKITDRLNEWKQGESPLELFKGLADAIEPELNALRDLWTQLIEDAFTILEAAFDTKFIKQLTEKATEMGVAIGKAIAAGIIASVPAAASTAADLASSVSKKVVDLPGRFWDWLTGKNAETSTIPLLPEGEGAGASKPITPAVPSQAQFTFPEPSKTQAVLDEQRARAVEDAAEAEKELVKLQEQEFSSQTGLLENQRRYQEEIEKSRTTLQLITVEINNAGVAFQQWLLAPVNKFQQAILQIKEKFADVTRSLRQRSIELGERFGLITPGKAGEQRRKLMETGLRQERQRLRLVQTPEERQRVQERIAAQATQLAEISTGAGRTKFAKQAQQALGLAGRGAAAQEELEIERIQEERQTAQRNIKELEGALRQTESAGGRRAILEQLQESFMALGQVRKATATQEELKRARIEEGREMAENAKRTAEGIQRLIEVSQLQLTALQEQTQAVRERMRIAPYSGYEAEAA
jgi:TP901 family phage tail tape measure protein